VGELRVVGWEWGGEEEKAEGEEERGGDEEGEAGEG
jgi:hypothetical protein